MKKRILYLFLFLLFGYHTYCFRCGSNSIEKKPTKINSENLDNKRILSNYYTPIKIMFDYTFIKSQNILDSTDLNDLINIFKEIGQYLSSLLSIVHINIKLESRSISNSCEVNKFSSNINRALYSYDIIIFPMINEDLDEEVLAQAWTCLSLKSNNRPLAGVVEISPDFSLIKYDTTYYMKYLLLHEISHVLGFSSSYFEELRMVYTETKNNEIKSYLKSPLVIERAKLHFNCDNIKGVQLENQGGSGSAGSHWEARYMLGDYMISTDYPEMTISDITLAYFEDTGYYKVNYYTGGLFRFGKNAGCNFLESDCVTNSGQTTLFPNEFCTEPEAFFCGSSHISRGECYIVKYNTIIESKFRHYNNRYTGGFSPADYCPVSYNYYDEDLQEYYYNPHNCNFGYNYRYDDIGEIIGKNSVCFESSLFPAKYKKDNQLVSLCYKVNCDRDLQEIQVYVGDQKISCPKDGGILNNPNGIEGQLKCPDYNIICTSTIWCNELFDCINKKSLSDLDTYVYKNYSKNFYDKYYSDKTDKDSIITFNLFIFYLSLLFLIN